ncbi:MAG TPA: UDP-3-O-(3-hydroxymyristoyl)glucosamine N-acyltransferase [Phycisphaeraceae bacterium]
MSSWTTQQIAQEVGGELVGPADLRIDGLEELALAQPGQLTFIGEGKYAGRWASSQASAALVSRGIQVEPGPGRALIFVDNADLAMAALLERFAPSAVLPPVGVHPTAVVDPTARLGEQVRIGPLCVIGPGVVVGDRCVLHSSVTLMQEVTIGADCVLWPGVVIRERCTVGDRCILHSNVNIGADGFGYRPDPQGRGLVKITHIGTVQIGHDVEIGAGTCIDRGKFSATVIGDGSKIDNLVQIGHNCRIGRCVVLSGSTGIAGSVTIGDGTMIGGMAAIKDHVTIGSRVQLTGCAQVMNDVPDGQTWGGSPAQPLKDAVQQVLALRRLPELVKQLKRR